ncbi:MAG: hypothetical protein ACPLRN_03560, partial [Microgenomates group bacterium]
TIFKMNKIILSKKQVQNLIFENRYKINPQTKFLSRCIDGRYENKDDLPALAIPGADLGELALILATANSFGFDVDQEKVYQSLIEVIGGEKNFQYHTDSHADPKIIAGGCGHFKQIRVDYKAYYLVDEDLKFFEKKLVEIKKNNQAKEELLHGEHLEGAILIVKGDWGIYPRTMVETEAGKKEVEVFVFHQDLVDQRHRALVKVLLKNKAVIFRDGEDEEWLYEVLCDMMENHLMETVKRLAPDLPIFNVKFKDDGSFEVKDL